MRLCQDRDAPLPTAKLVLADGTIISGVGFGATGETVGEVCFNTAMTGYQEILTDPSYAHQIITFTAPHIGNVGANDDDNENATEVAATAARGALVRAPITAASNYRARFEFDVWMRRRGIIGLSGIDTRALTALIREQGMVHGALAHHPTGRFDDDALLSMAQSFGGLEGADLAKKLGTLTDFSVNRGDWIWPEGFERSGKNSGSVPRVVVVDFGVKQNILRRLVSAGCAVSVVPPSASAEDILSNTPDGVVLSNGPGDPAATASHAVPVIKELIARKMPLLGICLGHQLLALALGAETKKMPQGHHGANHPIKDLRNGKVDIVSMNHGFTVDEATLPDSVEVTHTSLFDGTNSGFRHKDQLILSVQHHPEASPGPQDSFPIFEEFADLLKAPQAA